MNLTDTMRIAAVIHELVAARVFDDWTDLAETIKDRCARLRIPYDSGTVTEAVKLVARMRPVFAPPRGTPIPRRPSLKRDAARPLSRAEAADLWRRLCAALVREQAPARGRIRTMAIPARPRRAQKAETP